MGVPFVNTGEVARQYGLRTHIICNLFWLGHLDGDRCPVVAGRRMIPADYVEEIGEVLKERGYLEGKETVAEELAATG